MTDFFVCVIYKPSVNIAEKQNVQVRSDNFAPSLFYKFLSIIRKTLKN